MTSGLNVGDVVWLKGWQVGPFLVAGFGANGSADLVTLDGKNPRNVLWEWPGTVNGNWAIPSEMLTTEAPPEALDLLSPQYVLRLLTAGAAILSAASAIIWIIWG
jgi:hypothetical protein